MAPKQHKHKHEDNGESYDAADHGPVKVDAETAERLLSEAREAAEQAGFG